MNNLSPENSYMGKCSCGKVFIATKGAIHCHNCLYAKIAELEKQLATAEKVVLSYDMSFKERDIRDLDQQAKGIARFTELHLSGHSLFKSLSANYCSVLLIQAKQLCEGVK